MGNQVGSVDKLGFATATKYCAGISGGSCSSCGGGSGVCGTINSLGHEVTMDVDSLGRVLSQTDPLGHVTLYEYDEDGRRTAMTDALGNRTEYE